MATLNIDTLTFLLDNIKEGVFVYHLKECRLIYLNGVALESLGYSLDEITGKDPRIFTSELPDSIFWKTCHSNLKQKKQHTFQIELQRKDGTMFPAEISLSLTYLDDQELIIGFGKNITVQKEETARILQSEKSYKDLFDNSEDLIYIHDFEGKMIDVNQAVIDRYGYLKEEIIGKTPEIFGAPGLNDLSLVKQKINKAWNGKPQKLEWFSKTKTGEIFQKELVLRTGYYFDQKVIVATGRDISIRVERENKLQRYYQMFTNIQVGAFAVQLTNPLNEESLVIVDANHSAGYLLQVQVAKVIGKLISKVAFLDSPVIKKMILHTISNQEFRTINEYEYIDSKTGKISCWAIKIFPIADYSAGIFFENITTQIIDRDKLIASTILLKEAQMISGLGVIDLVFEPEFNVDISDSLRELLGIELAETDNYTIAEVLSWIHPNERKSLLKDIIGALQDEDFFKRNLRLINQQNGKTRDIQVAGKVHKGKKNRMRAIKATVIDISVFKELEMMLKLKNEELKTFVFRASHDLKGPVSSIRGLVNLAKEESGLTAKMEKFVSLMDHSISKLNRILNDLTQVAYVKEGKVSKVKVEFHQFVTDLIKEYNIHPDFKGVAVILEIDTDLAFNSDIILLESIFRNLIENSAKYKNIDAGDNYIKIKSWRISEGIFIRVEDNGIGIPDEAQSMVYDMFFRGTKESQGTGLGLYIVKNAIDKLNGEITIDSTHAKGCAFNVFLPS